MSLQHFRDKRAALAQESIGSQGRTRIDPNPTREMYTKRPVVSLDEMPSSSRHHMCIHGVLLSHRFLCKACKRGGFA